MQTEEVFTDVFENIQLQLEVIKGVKEKPWTMDRKLQIIRWTQETNLHSH